MDKPDDVPLGPTTPGSLVHKLWIGPTSSVEQNDLPYNSNAWPITLVHQMFTHCTSLRALAIFCVCQMHWDRLIGVIPPLVTSLWLGPVHGQVYYPYLPCASNLRNLTSLDTCMIDTEIRHLVLSPSIRTLRRVYSSADRVMLAFDQLECVGRATVLERLDIVCFGETEKEARSVLEETASRYEYDRNRVALVPKSSLCHNGQRDVIAVLFEDWTTYDGYQ
ncbi:hypothetical protein LXA43DRAFT_427952 [Ganoderma leucocontextum]|nr:hypothetical protein LXA43DRAFT_427952 [Ganoderma leucocontextum]